MNKSLIKNQSALLVHLGGAATCAALLAAGWCFGFGPLLNDSQETTTIVEQADAAQDKAQLSKAQLEAIRSKLASIGQEIDNQPLSLEPASAINPLLAELARWADEQRLTVTGTKAGSPVALRYYDYVPITLAGEGAYMDLLGFFRRLHSDRGDLGVVSFNASHLPRQGGVSYEIQLAWYVVSDGIEADEATAAVETR